MNFFRSNIAAAKADAEIIDTYDASSASAEETAAYKSAVVRENRRQAPKHGPSKARYLTSGQVRRMVARDEASARSKANKAYRRRWLSEQGALASLAGQVHVVETRAPGHPLRVNALKGLRAVFQEPGTEMTEAELVAAGQGALRAAGRLPSQVAVKKALREFA